MMIVRNDIHCEDTQYEQGLSERKSGPFRKSGSCMKYYHEMIFTMRHTIS
jgi:hypothetical protein